MDVFGKGEIRPLDPPGICFLCEQAPIQTAERVINTNRHFHPGGPTHLTGRKYVCENCATELGRALGMVAPDIYHALLEDHRKAERHVSDLMAETKQLRDFSELAERLLPKAEKVEAPKPRARKTPVVPVVPAPVTVEAAA